MMNLNYIDCTEIDEFDEIKNSKEITVQSKLELLRPSILIKYNNYLNDFSNIVNIPPSTYSLDEKDVLKSCFDKSETRDELIGKIINAQSDEFKFLCAYCLFYYRTTIDHYIPQTAYPEYCILPKNLLPCCSLCNSTKNQFWRKDGDRLFIHFYNDIIPNYKFLIGNLHFEADKPVLNYSLIHPTGVSLNLFKIISTHFSRLKLLELYKREGITKAISDIKADINSVKLAFNITISNDVLETLLQSKANTLRQTHGINYWQAIAYDLFANSNQFLDYLNNQV